MGDDYKKKVIAKGDEGSKFLAAKAAPTLKNSRYVDVLSDGMNGLNVLRLPRDHYCLVSSSSGDPKITDIQEYAASAVSRLFNIHASLGATPIAFADIIDSNTGDLELLDKIMSALVDRSRGYIIPIVNGENAILGSRITGEANVSITMLSMIPKRLAYDYVGTDRGVIYPHNHEIAIFNPKNKPIHINSDGVGTKTAFYERLLELEMSRNPLIVYLKKNFGLYRFGRVLYDSAAMKEDDAGKIGAEVQVLTDVVETVGDIPMRPLYTVADRFHKTGIDYILEHEDVIDRLRSYKDGVPAFNISGSAVSLIDEERLRNPLKPSAGEYLISISGKPNPRSNGITSLRKIMVDWLGEDWHKSKEGKDMLDYLAEPSTVLYPLFNSLIAQGLATSVYHNSGGAYDGKLARPLAKHGLYIKMQGGFSLDKRLIYIMHAADIDWNDAFGKWPMGNDGFVTTNNPEETMISIRKLGYTAVNRGILEKRSDGKTGVEIPDYNVTFSGKD